MAVQFQGKVLASGLESLRQASNAFGVSGRGSYTVEPAVEVSYGEPDKPDNILYGEDGQVRAASFSKLIEKLTNALVGMYISYSVLIGG
jgi:hypothetical protein